MATLRAYPWGESSKVGLKLARKYQTKEEATDIGQHSSLFCHEIIKRFKNYKTPYDSHMGCLITGMILPIDKL